MLWGGDEGVGNSSGDRFVWSSGDLGSVGAAYTDTIGDFNPASDVVDLSAAVNVTHLTAFSDLTSILSLSESGGTTTLSILDSGDAVQHIVFNDVSLDALINGASSGLSQAELLSALVNGGQLYLGDTMGSAAEDNLVADSAGESLFGMDGNDTLLAGAGNDILTGGEGDDLFIWESASLSDPANTDTVTDLVLGQDKLDISNLLPDFTTTPDVGDILPYFDDATVAGNGTVTLAMHSEAGKSQTIILENMDISPSGLDLAMGASTAEIVTALQQHDAFKFD